VLVGVVGVVRENRLRNWKGFRIRLIERGISEGIMMLRERAHGELGECRCWRRGCSAEMREHSCMVRRAGFVSSRYSACLRRPSVGGLS
jgi:hypothetical protein